jgi:hypothetical protein
LLIEFYLDFVTFNVAQNSILVKNSYYYYNSKLETWATKTESPKVQPKYKFFVRAIFQEKTQRHEGTKEVES